MSKSNHLAPAFKAELIDHAKMLLQTHGLDTDKAAQLAHQLADHMGLVWGGINVYFPKDIRKELSARDQLIYIEFNGSNHVDLARKFRVSVQWVYKIVERVRAADVASRQSILEL